MTDLFTLCDELERLAKEATQGMYRAKDFCVAPATEKHPAIHTVKVDPLQRRVLGSFQKADGDYLAACHPQNILTLISAVREKVKK